MKEADSREFDYLATLDGYQLDEGPSSVGNIRIHYDNGYICDETHFFIWARVSLFSCSFLLPIRSVSRYNRNRSESTIQS